MNLKKIAYCCLFGSISTANVDCSYGPLKVVYGREEPKEIKYPEKLKSTMKIRERETIKVTFPIVGSKCKFEQANVVLKAKGFQHYGYFPILCTEQSCKSTFNAAEVDVKRGVYDIKLVLVVKQESKLFNLEWSIGAVDYLEAYLGSNEKDNPTPDQQEEQYDLILPNIIRDFSPPKTPKSNFTATIFAIFIISPWVHLTLVLASLGMSTQIKENFTKLTVHQWGFYIFFLFWLFLAMLNFQIIGTFAALKVASVLSLPTFYFGLVGLREAGGYYLSKSKSSKKDN